MKEIESLWPRLKGLLPSVTKAARYTGGELGSIKKDSHNGEMLFALAYPDLYEIGMSSLAIHILYHLLNRRENLICERVFAPWTDMEETMRREGIPLFTLESSLPVSAFDIVGFTLQHESTFTNVLNMLDLASLPLLTKDRGEHDPLVIGGGPAVFNPEPLSSFFDLFLLGEAEEALLELIDAMEAAKREGVSREETLRRLSKIGGVYVPSLYLANYAPAGSVIATQPVEPDTPKVIKRRWSKDFEGLNSPTQQILPFIETVHDRCSIEIARGCARGCRFCQASVIYRPRRERSKESIISSVKGVLSATGYEEVSLASLSSSDHENIKEIVQTAMVELESARVAISLPSLRMDNFSLDLAKEIQRVKRTGLTFAPEAGTQRLRDVINKNLTEEEILSTVKAAFEGGWEKIKLYFMIGLPTEGTRDLEGIVDLVEKIHRIGKDSLPKRKAHRLKISVSLSSFVPKAHTPFQWAEQVSLAEIEEKQDYLKRRLTMRAVSLKWHDAKMSAVEGLLARGDRRLSAVLLRAFEKGAKFDSWKELFSFNLWQEALEEEGLSFEDYLRKRDLGEILPWSHLSTGVSEEFLKTEYLLAGEGRLSQGCLGPGCKRCGLC